MGNYIGYRRGLTVDRILLALAAIFTLIALAALAHAGEPGEYPTPRDDPESSEWVGPNYTKACITLGKTYYATVIAKESGIPKIALQESAKRVEPLSDMVMILTVIESVFSNPAFEQIGAQSAELIGRATCGKNSKSRTPE